MIVHWWTELSQLAQCIGMIVACVCVALATLLIIASTMAGRLTLVADLS